MGTTTRPGSSTAMKLAGAAALGAGAFMMTENVNAGSCCSSVDWDAVRKDLEALCENEDALNTGADNFPGAIGGGGYVAPMMVRLAWHSAGTWCTKAKNGGSDGGTMRFEPEAGHGANAGLEHARALIEPIKKKHPAATYADLYILASIVAIEEMGGPQIPFRSGRSDAPAASTPEKDSRFSPDGRLPDADKGGYPETAQHMRDIFYRMGFNDQEIVALSGAHALGHCHTDRSGYWGPWTRSPSSFNNEYFRLLYEEQWSIKKTHKGGA